MKLNWRKAIAYEERSVWLRLDWWALKSLIFLTTTSSIVSSQFTKSDLKLSPLLLIQWLLEFIFVFLVVLLLAWQSCSSYSLVHRAKVPNITRTARLFHRGSCNLHWWCLFLHKVICILAGVFQYWWRKELQHLRCLFWHMFSYKVICGSEIGYPCGSRAVALTSAQALYSWEAVIDSHLFYGIVLFSLWIDASGSFKGSIHLNQLTVAFSLLSPKEEPHQPPPPHFKSQHSNINFLVWVELQTHGRAPPQQQEKYQRFWDLR